MALSTESASDVAYIRGISLSYVACITLLYYDSLLILPKEIECIWSSNWNLIKTLYLLQRYLPFIDTVLLAIPILVSGPSLHTGIILNHIGYYSLIIGIATSECILTIRVCAICRQWRGIKILKIFLFTLWFCVASSSVALFAVAYRAPDRIVTVKGHYAIISESPLVSIPLGTLLAYDFLLASLMIAAAYRSYRARIITTLSVAVFRNGGLVYYLYILGLTLSAIIVTCISFSAPASTVDMISTFLAMALRIIHSAITSRVVLDIKSAVIEARSQEEVHVLSVINDVVLDVS